MVDFNIFIDRVMTLDEFIRKEGTRVLVEQGEDIAEMMKGQHHEGLNRDDKMMQRGYSKGYAGRRRKKGLQTSYVDLHFSGQYHDKLKVVPVKEGVDVTSSVDYEQYIRKNFTGMAGLTKDNAAAMSEVVSEILAPMIKKFLVG